MTDKLPKFTRCPRCLGYGYEHLRTHAYCTICNYSIDLDPRFDPIKVLEFQKITKIISNMIDWEIERLMRRKPQSDNVPESNILSITDKITLNKQAKIEVQKGVELENI